MHIYNSISSINGIIIAEHNLACINTVYKYKEPFKFDCLRVVLCGGAGAASKEMAEAPRAMAMREKKEEVEKGIKIYSIMGEDLIILTPDRIEEENHIKKYSYDTFLNLANRFKTINNKNGEATAYLNLAIIYMFKGDLDESYEYIEKSKKIFSHTGNLAGLAYSFEWSAYLFRHSGETEIAEQELSYSYQIFSYLNRKLDVSRIENMYS